MQRCPAPCAIPVHSALVVERSCPCCCCPCRCIGVCRVAVDVHLQPCRCQCSPAYHRLVARPPSPPAVRNLVEQAQFAHLCTIMCNMHHRRAGYPFGSLVDFAADGAGHPIFRCTAAAAAAVLLPQQLLPAQEAVLVCCRLCWAAVHTCPRCVTACAVRPPSLRMHRLPTTALGCCTPSLQPVAAGHPDAQLA